MTDDPIVTYGDDWSIGKELLLRALMKRRGTLVTHQCACCRISFEPEPGDCSYECPDCRNDPNARSAYK